MQIVEVRDGDIASVELQGRIDSSTAPGLQNHLIGLVRSGCTGMILDFRHVAYVSSAGFRALLVAARHGEESRCGLAFCGLADEVRRMFEIGAFDEVFTILATREECAGHLLAGSAAA